MIETKIKLTIVLDCKAKDDMGDVHSIDVVDGSSLVEVLSKFLLVVAMIAPKLMEFRKRNDVDLDIPF